MTITNETTNDEESYPRSNIWSVPRKCKQPNLSIESTISQINDRWAQAELHIPFRQGSNLSLPDFLNQTLQAD